MSVLTHYDTSYTLPEEIKITFGSAHLVDNSLMGYDLIISYGKTKLTSTFGFAAFDVSCICSENGCTLSQKFRNELDKEIRKIRNYYTGNPTVYTNNDENFIIKVGSCRS